MGPLNIVLWLAGVALIGIGYTRARAPWVRYQALKAQDRNYDAGFVEKQFHNSWKGGVMKVEDLV